MTAYIHRSKLLLLFFSILSFLLVSCNYKKKLTATDITIAPEYGSNMVFRKGDSIVIHGTCSSFGVLGVRLQDGLKIVEANKNGDWKVSFPPINFKGSFSIAVEGAKQFIQLENLACGKIIVIAGDAWLGSKEVVKANELISASQRSNNNVRIFMPEYKLNPESSDLSGTWAPLSSNVFKWRSSFAAMLGSALSDLENETIGVICLTYPGTSVHNFNKANRQLSDSLYPRQSLDSIWNGIENKIDKYKSLADTSNNGIRRDVLNRYYDDWEWTETSLPIVTDKRWYLKNKIVWLRKKIYISEKFITSDFTIRLGTIRGHFDFYFNGQKVSHINGEVVDFKITVPDSLFKVWTNLLTVRMVCGDSLTGLYETEPTVFNKDLTYDRSIGEGWTLRTYYEPELPDVTQPKNLWPLVYENFFTYFEGKPVDQLIVTGGEEQYMNATDGELVEMIRVMEDNFSSGQNYIYLVSKESYVDSIVNHNKFIGIRNQQLSIAASEGWNIINTLNVTRDRGDIALYYQKLLQCYIEQY